MNALEWLRSKATTTFDSMTVSAEEAALNGGAPGTYKITRQYFKGTLPARMAFEVRKSMHLLVNNDNEVERILIGGQYRGDFGRCEYFHTTYELEATA